MGFLARVRKFDCSFRADRPARQTVNERREISIGRFHQDHLRRGFIQNFCATDCPDFLNVDGGGRAFARIPENVAALRWTGY